MRIFQYTAFSRNGDKLAGEVEGISRENVLAHLQELGHFPVEIKEADGSANSNTQADKLFSKGPSSPQITHFTRELAMLLKAGMPLDRSLLLLARDAPSKKLSKLIGNVHARINDGKSLHEAMAGQAGAFPPAYVNMVRIAEASGTLYAVLARIAQTRQRAEKLRSKALSATLYPGLLIAVALAAVTIMLVFVVPRFKEMVLQAGTEAPGPAQVVFAVSDWLVANGTMLGLGLCAALIMLLFLAQHPTFRRLIEAVLLKLPLIGHILRISLSIRFTRNLGMLLENGVDLPTAMKLVRDVVGNERAAIVLDTAYDHLRKGKSFLDPIANSGLFPPVLINMLRVGEETGSLTQSLLHMADMFEDKLDTTVQRTLTILEPVIILLVSGFIATVIMSILSAVISINDLAL